MHIPQTSHGRHSKPSACLRAAAAGCLAVVCTAMVATGCGEHTAPVITRQMQARDLTAELQVRISKAADAANRAVMADTDETSVAFAHEADQETQRVQRDLDELTAVLKSLDYADELALLQEFRAAFAKYRTLDHDVLELAVENTNLKAQRLAFGSGHKAADAFCDSLDTAAAAVSGQDVWQIRALALRASVAVRHIQVLQNPHIAASEDAVMTALEKQMATSEAQARSALHEAGELSPAFQPAVAAANATLAQFIAINRQILTLSRRNSNVRSLALSLGQKRTLTAACEGSLRALSDRLAKHVFPATR